MISNAFKSAYTNKVSQQNQAARTIGEGIKDTATLALGIAGFSGGLGSGNLAKGAKHALAGRVGGIGGNIMLASLQEKKDTAQENQEIKNVFTGEEVSETIQSQLGDNPINRSALKQLSTVFEKLTQAREEKIINEKGKIDTSIGEVDPNSELGKKILGGLNDNDR